MRQRRVRPGAALPPTTLPPTTRQDAAAGRGTRSVTPLPVSLPRTTTTLSRTTLSVLALSLLTAPLVALLPACGRSDVDRVQLETQVQRSLESRAHPRLEVRNVSCPDRLEARKGAQTRCTVTTATGKTVTALITVTGTANGRLQFDLKLDQNPS